jgi:hypothetical protein
MNVLEKIKTHSWWIILVFVIILNLRQCGINRNISRIDKSVKTINGSLDSLQNSCVTKQELEKSVKQNMFNFLIYEDDFDKGKTSLSEIKSKIEQP